jgi:hypothetical protein
MGEVLNNEVLSLLWDAWLRIELADVSVDLRQFLGVDVQTVVGGSVIGRHAFGQAFDLSVRQQW